MGCDVRCVLFGVERLRYAYEQSVYEMLCMSQKRNFDVMSKPYCSFVVLENRLFACPDVFSCRVNLFLIYIIISRSVCQLNVFLLTV